MNWADWALRAFALLGVATFSWQVGKHGIRYVMTEVAGWFSVAKNDFLDLKGYVLVLENRIIALEEANKTSISPVKQSPPTA